MSIDNTVAALPDLATVVARLPRGPRTRFAPAPTGFLHLGHLVNAALVWGIARATGGSVVLRIEDHDRQRSRPAFEAAILQDLERLGLVPDEPALAVFRSGRCDHRQSDVPERYAEALVPFRARGLVYACACARSTFAAWQGATGRAWSGPGCPGGCADRGLPDDGSIGLRVAVGMGEEAWVDLALGDRSGRPDATGDPLVRDRAGNWSYAWCVVVDDLAQGIDLVIRGQDLTDATPIQLRLARLLTGRSHPARFLHHRLVRRPDGSKLSKADGATALRELLDQGADRAVLLADAARAAGLPGVPARLEPDELGALVAGVAGATGATGAPGRRVAPTGR